MALGFPPQPLTALLCFPPQPLTALLSALRRARRILAPAAVLMLLGCDGLKGSGPAASSSATAATATSTPVLGSAASTQLPEVHAAPPRGSATAALPSFAALVKGAQPAVVVVKAWVKRANAFGREVTQAQGVGSGFVYDAKGLLLTNNHVIDGASEIVVRFVDGRELAATVVGADKPTDVAVLKVDEQGLPALPLGDSAALQVGDWVVAIGNPFGLERTVSAGILSAKGRTSDDVQGLDPAGYFNFLQTDASINPGNSGGPLLNLAGQVVGINAAVRANANNIGFAIPMEMVLQLLPTLLREGRIHRSALGIYVDELAPDDAKRLNRPREGAKVTKVMAGKAADKAGLAEGDIVLMFDNTPVANPNQLKWLASIAGINKTVSLRVARGSRIFDTRVTLGALDTP